MPKYQRGDCVGLIYREHKGLVEFVGWGKYIGYSIPEKEATGSLSNYLRSTQNHCLEFLMDTGEIAWSCECWWGLKEDAERRLKRADNIQFLGLAELRQMTTNTPERAERT